MDAVQREAILATPLDTLTLPTYARSKLGKENDFRRNRSEEDQAVYEMKSLVTVADWLSLSLSDRLISGQRRSPHRECLCGARRDARGRRARGQRPFLGRARNGNQVREMVLGSRAADPAPAGEPGTGRRAASQDHVSSQKLLV